MLLLKEALPAYEALGEGAYWIELLEYITDRVVTPEPHRVLAMGVAGLAAVDFAPDASPPHHFAGCPSSAGADK